MYLFVLNISNRFLVICAEFISTRQINTVANVILCTNKKKIRKFNLLIMHTTHDIYTVKFQIIPGLHRGNTVYSKIYYPKATSNLDVFRTMVSAIKFIKMLIEE